ncbi:MAG: hypothetical protein M1818_004806 [Claussenomyces sp. TS43310]|nr:MAG: hypothetical protein M1818_004806 [Claussenomyces sp. TS43310]
MLGNGEIWDNQYGSSPPFVLVSYQNQFLKTPFQLGTGGVIGCTMVTIISKRAVWMAHIWEGYAFQDSFIPSDPLAGKPDDKPGTQTFKDRAICGITGAEPSVPLTFPLKGPSLDKSYFNRPGDNTVAYIMSPGDGNKVYEYPNKLGELKSALMDLVPGIHIELKNYVAIDVNDEEEAKQLWNTARGMALFQYDPDSDGQGNPSYRLFYETIFNKVAPLN